MAEEPAPPTGGGVSPFDLPSGPPPRERIWDLCLAIAAGGALGGALRHGLNSVLQHEPDALPWSTFIENVLGSFLLALVMVFLLEVWPPNRYARPFLGVGMLGGFTTFSAYTSEARVLLLEGEGALALFYLLASPALGLAAAAAGTIIATAFIRSRRRSSA